MNTARDDTLDFFDIGVNLNSGQFRDHVNDVLERAAAHGVKNMIAISSDVHESLILKNYPEFESVQVWTTAGVHPHQAKTFDDRTLAVLRDCYRDDRCVAIGECGLDYNRMYSPKDQQQTAFIEQIALAHELTAPVYLHQRDAHADFMDILRVYGAQLKGVVHCFTEGTDTLKDYLDMGFYIGVTGWVCDERRGHDLKAALEFIPLDRLLLETDAPYLKPRTYKGPLRLRHNEPCLLPHIAQNIADHLQLDLETLVNQTRKNAFELFDCG